MNDTLALAARKAKQTPKAASIGALDAVGGTKAAKRFIELLTGDPDTPMDFRLIHDSERSAPAIVLHGSLTDLVPEIKTKQAEGYGVFVVINEGGNNRDEITKVRALYIDGDDIPLPTEWHLKPDFIVQRSATRWHAYWLVNDCPLDKFTECQKRLIARYGSDKGIHDLPRVMRLPGTLHLKGGK